MIKLPASGVGIANMIWLSVIGINESGSASLSACARALISSAALVVGGKRHLQLAGDLVKCETRTWDSPIEKTIAEIMSLRPMNVCILASGDPFCYGIGATLTRYIPITEMLVIPAPSCFSLAVAKLGWALQDVVTIGLNGRAMEKIVPHLQPKAKILALSTDETTPALLAELLTRRGFGEAKFWLLEHLGGQEERIREGRVSGFGILDIEKLNMVAIEIPANIVSKAIPVTSGLADDFF